MIETRLVSKLFLWLLCSFVGDRRIVIIVDSPAGISKLLKRITSDGSRLRRALIDNLLLSDSANKHAMIYIRFWAVTD
jgi:hypothetical protein